MLPYDFIGLVRGVCVEFFFVVGTIDDARRDDLLLGGFNAVDEIIGGVDGVDDHAGGVEGGLDPDFLVLRHHLEVFLATTAAGHDLNVFAAGFLDGLQHADGGLVVHGEDGVDMLVGGEDIREVLQTIFTREFGGAFDELEVGGDLLLCVDEAFEAEFGNGTGGRDREDGDGGVFANLFDDVLRGGNAHAFIVAGNEIDAVGLHFDIEADDFDAAFDGGRERGFHALPLREGDDGFSTPGFEIVQLLRHLFGGLAGQDLVVNVRQLFAALFGKIGDGGDPAMGDGGGEDTDLVFHGWIGGLKLLFLAGDESCAQHQRADAGEEFFHVWFLLLFGFCF